MVSRRSRRQLAAVARILVLQSSGREGCRHARPRRHLRSGHRRSDATRNDSTRLRVRATGSHRGTCPLAARAPERGGGGRAGCARDVRPQSPESSTVRAAPRARRASLLAGTSRLQVGVHAVGARHRGEARARGVDADDRAAACVRSRHRAALMLHSRGRRTYMIAAPPGTAVTATGNSRPWRVTVRPEIIPTVEPNTTSLSQCLLSGRRDTATYDAKMYAGTAPFHPRW